jgi:lipopolysaccharide biosynthesis regulator YciM
MKGRSVSAGIETAPPDCGSTHGERSAHQQHLSEIQPGYQRQRRRGRIAIVIAATAIGLWLGVLLVSYSSKAYQTWHERRLLRQAATLLQQGQLSESAQIAANIARQHPDSVAALSIMADTAERQNREEAVAWRERIARLLPRDPESQLNFASAALRFGQLDLAREALDRISSRDRDSAAFHIVAGWLARAEGNFAEQEEQFAAAVSKEPKNDLYQFNLAALQIRAKDPEKSRNARQVLQRLTGVAPYRTGALRALLNDAVDRDDFSAADGFAQQLQMSPEVTFTDYLLCLNFYRKLDEKKFRRLLEKVKPFAARNASDLASLIEWMNQNGLAADVVKWVDKMTPAQLSSSSVSVGIADAYATVKNWSRLKRWTVKRNWADADYLRLAYGAIAENLRSGNKTNSEFQTLWQSADELSQSQPQRELNLARLATKSQLPNQAEALWLRLGENPTMRREALDNLRQLYRARDEPAKLYDVLQRLHESSPNDVSITANLARLGLTLGKDTERSHQLAKEAYEHTPDEINCALTYSFSLYRLGRNAEALAVLQSLPSDQLHDPHAAVYVALILAGTNEVERAKGFIKAAEDGKIYREEKELLAQAKARLIEASAPASAAESASPP